MVLKEIEELKAKVKELEEDVDLLGLALLRVIDTLERMEKKHESE